MGLDFIRDKKDSFEQKRDRSRETELEEEDLITLSITQNEIELFRCCLNDLSAVIIPGHRLILRAYSETHIEVGQASKVIGVVAEDEAPRLSQRMKTSKVHTGILAVVIMTEPDIGGEFMVRPRRPFTNKKS